jgi:hypothetical protein
MPAPAAECALPPAGATLGPLTSSRGGPNINPVTKLSTDYLNHFAEVVMVLEMSSTSPECLDDLREWQPKTYVEHFAASRFSNRDEVIAAYHTADPIVREALDRAADMLNEALIKTRDIVLRRRVKPDSAKAAARALAWLKPLIARTSAVINGTAPDITERQGPQAAVDVIFKR